MENDRMRELAILVNTRDRPSEVALLLSSLYTQTYQDFDVYILDDNGGTSLNNYHFFNCMLGLFLNKGIKVYVNKSSFQLGVSKARQTIVDWALKKPYTYLARVDDDVILEPDFIERLVNVIKVNGYDLASGVTPPLQVPTFIRNPKYIGEIVNRVIIDKDGKYVFNGDDCGMAYTDSVILPAHHFRSSALYKAEIHKKVNYTPTRLSKHGFREEQIFSYKLQMEGYKLGVDTGAIAWHQMTPSGGERFPTQNQDVVFNEQILKEFTIEHKDKLRELFPEIPLTKQELMRETNLIR